MGELVRIGEGQGLTEKQRVFVDALLNGAEVRDAMTLAGYSEGTLPTFVLGSMAVQNAIQAACEARLRGDLLAKALRTMEELLDAKIPSATRYQAAKFIAERQSAGDRGDKPLSEMTEEELMEVIAKAEKVKNDARAGQLIDVTPKNGA